MVLGPEPITIGRLPESAVMVTDPNASRRHAEIRRVGNDVVVVDLNSTNGTRVNGATDPGAEAGRRRPDRDRHHRPPIRDLVKAGV